MYISLPGVVLDIRIRCQHLATRHVETSLEMEGPAFVSQSIYRSEWDPCGGMPGCFVRWGFRSSTADTSNFPLAMGRHSSPMVYMTQSPCLPGVTQMVSVGRASHMPNCFSPSSTKTLTIHVFSWNGSNVSPIRSKRKRALCGSFNQN